MFGSTDKKDNADYMTREELSGTLPPKQAAATVAGIAQEMQIIKQQMRHMQETNEKLIGLVGTLQLRLEAINDARVRELQSRGTGPTAVSNGSINQSSD